MTAEHPKPSAADSPFKPVWGLFAILVGVTLIAGVQSFFRPKEIVPWRQSYTQGVTEAETTGKPLLLYFTADWCGPCRQMRRTTWADPRVEETLRSYVPTRIDIDQDKDLAMRYGIAAVPSFILIHPSTPTPQRATDGYLSPADFLSWLQPHHPSPTGG